MRNKTYALFGIGTYIFSVIVSAQNSDGSYIMPDILIAISGLATVVFIISATMHLRKSSKLLSTTLFLSEGFKLLFTFIQFGTNAPNGSFIILITNVTAIISLIAFFLVVIKLYNLPDSYIMKQKRAVYTIGQTTDSEKYYYACGAKVLKESNGKWEIVIAPIAPEFIGNPLEVNEKTFVRRMLGLGVAKEKLDEFIAYEVNWDDF